LGEIVGKMSFQMSDMNEAHRSPFGLGLQPRVFEHGIPYFAGGMRLPPLGQPLEECPEGIG
jgi:hypothetical protein